MLLKKTNSLTYSKIWTNDNQVQDFTKLDIYIYFLILFMLLKKTNSLTYSKIWTNDNQVQDFTKLIN